MKVKNFYAFIALGALMLMLFSCTKEIITTNNVVEKTRFDTIEIIKIVKDSTNTSPIVFTNNPPKELFDQNTPYGYSNMTFMEKNEADNSNRVGYFYVWTEKTLDKNGEVVVIEHYDWFHTLRARKFWGIYKSKIYVSESYDVYDLKESDLSQMRSLLQRDKLVIGSICNTCNNPLPYQLLLGFWSI